MSDAWFGADGDPGERIREGSAATPADWPAEAVDAGFAEDEEAYYDALHEATVAATGAAAAERERAEDVQLAAAVRAMDDAERTANELAERVSDWGNRAFSEDGTGIGYARKVARREADDPAEVQVVSLAERVDDLIEERDSLRAFIEARAPAVAPNLADMAGPVLAARLIALAGGLGSLAKKPSGTVQVLGAEDALFAHLAGRAPSPKHGVIFTHEFVRGTRPEDRGSAARALAGKLSLAARADYYSGEYRPVLHEDLADRMETIRARGER
jgi:nucleolar protein 56